MCKYPYSAQSNQHSVPVIPEFLISLVPAEFPRVPSHSIPLSFPCPLCPRSFPYPSFRFPPEIGLPSSLAHPIVSPWPLLRQQKKAGAPVRNTRLKNKFKKTAATYSPALHCSTIGASGLNCSVRNGKRWDTAAITAINLSAAKSIKTKRDIND